MVRATTGGVLRGYRSNLMNSFITLNKARETVLTQRNFNSYAEDPASAAQAFQLRKSRMDVQSQYKLCDSAYRKYQSAWSCLDTIDKLVDTDNGSSLTTLKGMTLKMLNDPTGDARKTLSTALDQLSQTIVQTMNQKYGDNFIFAGADGKNVPFEIVDDKLYYRGVPVDAAVPDVVQSNGTLRTVDAAGNIDDNGTYYIKSDSITTMSAADFAALDPAEQAAMSVMRDATGAAVKVDEDGNFDPNGNFVMVTTNIETISQEDYDKAVQDVAKLDYLVNEKNFIDIGLGFQENENGQLIESSGFDEALNGLTFLGYGLDADGDPKNIYSLVQKLKEIADRIGTEKGEDGNTYTKNWSDADYEEFRNLVSKMEAASSEFKVEYTNMDAGTTKLKNNLALLEENFYNLQEQYSALEDVDMADAITSFVWAQYCYNAALKVGNSVLSESLMDYLN